MEEKPNYYAVIPADVRYDNDLKDKAKLLYGEITALSNQYGYCYASNKYFANLYKVSTTTISTLIKNLIDCGYIESEIIYKENSKEIDKRYLKIFKGGYLKNFKWGIKENLKDNNTSINKYYNNNELNELFEEFLELRKKIKCKNTDRAINLLLNKLNNYDDNTKKQMLEQSIMNSWKSVYEIKNKKEISTPTWMNKKYEEEVDEGYEQFLKEIEGYNQ